MTQQLWTDEQLSAFMDGELPQAEMEALAADIESDPHLSARVDKLVGANAAFVKSAEEIEKAPVSARLKALMDAVPAAEVVQFKPRSVRTFLLEHRAIAASLLCAVAVWGVTSVSAGRAPDDPLGTNAGGMILASSPVGRMLETAATGEVVSIADKASGTPRLTFASDDGSFCRQFDVARDTSASAAIACRKGGAWYIQIAAYGLPAPTSDFQTASASRSPALEAFLDNRMSGDALTATEERELLQSNWKRKL